ncbi:ABC transporter ATP-binding protein/permease [Tsuneonella sp. YG55]|uniref:ABC transporter ATP-binding protein/permease n=1 Tax=Tsuneonella litorea TaxID=2976475 RepID=A0A9X3AM77_9SPHN|nr:ABC transporter ATP-binding protein [Tsuneonella litorea]MCT2560223.1 ABC transporter ATP-binding protein/permease [Tsuneonella litorea]
MSLRAFILANKLRFAGLIAAALIHVGTAIFLASSVSRLLDVAIGRTPRQDYAALDPGVSATFALGLLFVTTAFQRRLTDGLGLAFVHDLRIRLFRHILRAAPGPASEGKRANLLLPFVGDLTAIRLWVGDGVARLMLGCAVTVLLIGYIAIDHPLLASLLAATIAILAACAWSIHGPLDRVTRDVRRKRGGLSSFVAGRLEAATTIVAMGRSGSEATKLERRSRDLISVSMKRAWLVGALRGLSQSSAAIMLVLMLTVMGSGVGRGEVTPGEVMGLVSLAGVMGHALQDMGRSFELFVPGHVAFQRIDRLLALAPRVKRRKRRARESDTGLILSKIATAAMAEPYDLFAKPGEIILLDGPSGSGKSALMATLGGIQAPSRGEVWINGAELSAMRDTERQRQIGIASHAVPLLPGSVGMNLKYRHPSASNEEIDRLIGEMGMGGMNLANERRLNEPRNALSSSEYAAILVLRAMLGSPPLLLLDSVDGSLPDSVAKRLAAKLSTYPGVVVITAQRHALRQIATHNWRIENGGVRASTRERLHSVPGPDDKKTNAR